MGARTKRSWSGNSCSTKNRSHDNLIVVETYVPRIKSGWTKETAMGGWKEKMEKLFAAMAFAEENRHEDALQVAGLKPVKADLSLERVFAAAAFAEANSPETVREILGLKQAPRGSGLEDFLSAVGLKGVRVWYGVAHLAA